MADGGQPKDQLVAFADVGYEAVACDCLKTSALTALDYSVDWPEDEHGTNWGLCVANRESLFKVLDVYEREGKTQIALLHLLDDDRWRIFANAEFDMPGLGIEDIRARFEARCSQELISELSTEDWLERCSYPVGMNLSGGLYAPDPMPAEALWRVGDTGFR